MHDILSPFPFEWNLTSFKLLHIASDRLSCTFLSFKNIRFFAYQTNEKGRIPINSR